MSITAADLAGEIGATEDRAARLLAVAAEVVETYAPDAPDVLQNEAVIRFAGYLAQSDFGTIRTEEIGPKRIEYHLNHAAMFRNSGAAGLLTGHKRRRAGAIGAPDVPASAATEGGGYLRWGS